MFCVFGSGSGFQVDDGIAAGPADVVFPALRRYAAAVEPHGETIRFDKCSAWSPSLGAALAVHPAYIADCESVAGLTRAHMGARHATQSAAGAASARSRDTTAASAVKRPGA